MATALLDLQYMPNINWMINFLAHDRVVIEREENFVKSTYRNRCEIGTANGKLALTLPVQGGRDHHQKYADTKIAYLTPWQQAHWQGVKAAYGSAPFFDFYAHHLEPFYTQSFDLLFDYNLKLLKVLMSLLKLKKEFEFTSVYEKNPADMIDLRSNHRSINNAYPAHSRYYQIFEDRNGFISNLSAIDLIFHEGPAALTYLQSHV